MHTNMQNAMDQNLENSSASITTVSEGLVELLSNRGAIVTSITGATVREIFALLGALAQQAAREMQ